MYFHITPYAIASATAAIIALTVAIVAYSRRAVPGGTALMAFMLATAVWAGFTAIEYAAIGIPAKVFWAKLEYIGVLTTPVFYLLLALSYNRSDRWLTRRNIALLFIPPAISQLLVVTNDWHGLIWSSFAPAPAEQNLIVYGHGAWFWFGVVGYGYALLLLGTIILLRAAFRYSHIYRAQTLAIIIGTLIPWTGNLIYLLGQSPFPGYEPTSFLTAVSGAIFAWGIFRFHLLDLVPIARETVLDNLSDGVLVLDMQQRIVDANAVLRAFIQKPLAELVGQTTEKIFGARADDLRVLAQNPDAHSPHTFITLDQGETRRVFDLRVTRLNDRRGELSGYVILLRDITARKRAEEALWASEQRYRLLAENAADMMWVLDNDTQTFKYASPAVYRLFGYTEQEFVGKHVSEVVTPASYEFIQTITPPRVAKTLNGSTDYYVDQVEMLHRDGHVVPAEITMRFVINPLTGKIEGTGIARDITERKRAEEALRQANRALEASQAQIVQEQRAVAMLHERQRLGRDLHDNLGQVLGFVNLQAMAVRKFLADGNFAQADAALARLGEVAQNAQAEMRAYILQLKSPAQIERRFLPALMNMLKQFENETAVTLHLELAPEITTRGFDAAFSAELLSIIQESLNNIAKHARAQNVHLAFLSKTDTAEISIADDGRGFDLTAPIDAQEHFGLSDMRERCAQIGASLQIESAPGQGTRIVLCVPLRATDAGE